jgi:hypothetical protein
MKSHGDFVCATRDEYLRHMKTAHPGKLTDAQLGVLASRNGRPVENMFMSCPLCGVEDVDGGIPNHLVGHLRLLALKSLPIYEEGTEEYDESDSEQNSLATSRPRTRSTIRDDRDRLGAVTRGDSTSSSGEDSNPELADHLKTTDKRPELENDDASDVAPYGKGRGSEWGFIPATWGPSLEPEDPIVKALSRPVPPRRKPRVIRMDPDCAICYKPVAAGCPCESIALEQSVQQAESRVMRPLLQKGRTWVKVHAVNHLHRVWEEEGFRPFKRHREVQEDKEPHGDHQNEQDEDQQHRHGQLGKPQEEQQASEMKPTLPSQEEVNDEWARRIQTFPEMAEHFFGLFEFTLPTDDDVKQIKSDLLSRAEQVIRNGQPEKG